MPSLNLHSLPFEEANKSLSLPGATSLASIIARSRGSVRKSGLALVDSGGVLWSRCQTDPMICDGVVRGSKRDYIVTIDREQEVLGCECKAFEFDRRTCKHIVALALQVLKDQDPLGIRLDPDEWIQEILAETRNVWRRARLNGMRAVFDDAMADKLGGVITRRRRIRHEVVGYDLPGGIWCGDVPWPVPGNRVYVELAGLGKRWGTCVGIQRNVHDYYGALVDFDAEVDQLATNQVLVYGPELMEVIDGI